MLANIESFFIFLLIAGASALFNWLKRKQENETDWELPPPPARRTPPPRTQQTSSRPAPEKATSWEEELRRMLEGTVPTTRTPVPPPVIVPEQKPVPPIARAPEPPVSPQPAQPVFQERYYKAHCNHCGEHIEFAASATEEVISCPHCHQLTVLRPFQDTKVEALAHQKELSSFAATTRKFALATQLNEKVAAHMHGALRPQPAMTSNQPQRRRSAEISETISLFRSPATARQAIIASLILNPPKALQD